MTDYPKALAAAREALADIDARGMSFIAAERTTLIDTMRNLLAALDTARGDVRQKVKDTLTDYLDHYPHPEFLDAVMAHFVHAAPPAADAALADTQRAIIEAAERRGYERGLKEEAALAVSADFTEWLAREMPAGTVIGDPRWWASMIARRFAQFANKESTND